MADPAGPRPGLKTTVIEVIEPFPAPGGPLAPGARLQGWKAPDGWRVLFYGAELRELHIQYQADYFAHAVLVPVRVLAVKRVVAGLHVAFKMGEGLHLVK